MHNIFYLYNLRNIKRYLNLRLFFEILLFNVCSNRDSIFIAQNHFVKKKLIQKLKLNKKNVFIADFYNAVPIFFNKLNKKDNLKNININKKRKNIIFPYHFYKNKNFHKLHLFDEIISKKKLNCNIHLTIKKEDFVKLNNKYKFKNIFNLGTLNTDQLYNSYKKFDYVLNLSKFESMCLPLYEAIFFSKNIITIKADFILEKIKTKSVMFDSFNKRQIEKVLKLAFKLSNNKRDKYYNYFKSTNSRSLAEIIKINVNRID